MLKGIVCALSACFIWGLIFIVPGFMSSFSAIEIAMGRYMVYGIFPLGLIYQARRKGGCRRPLKVWLKSLY